jgi:hypothetical protein
VHLLLGNLSLTASFESQLQHNAPRCPGRLGPRYPTASGQSHGMQSRHVTVCHGMSRHVTACHGMSRHVTACHGMSRHVTACHGMSWHVTAVTVTAVAACRRREVSWTDLPPFTKGYDFRVAHPSHWHQPRG